MMGHPNPEALRHLLKAAIGVEFTTRELDSAVCERCELTNAKEQISRVARERPITPFDSVSWDIIYIKDRLKNKKRVLHTVDDYTRVYFIFILFNDKLNSIVKYFKAITAYIFRQYRLIIRV